MTKGTVLPRFAIPALAVLSLFAIVGHSDAALAGTKDLPGTHSESNIKGSCDKAGGVFFSNSAGYSCVGGGGQVACTKDGKCMGECATCGDAIKGGNGSPNGVSPTGILSGTTQKASGNASTKTTDEPVKTAGPAKTGDPAGVKKPVDEVEKANPGGSEDHHTKK